MALLAFEDVRSSPVADLMDIAQRQKTASELNAAILASQAQVQHRLNLHVAATYQGSGTWQSCHTSLAGPLGWWP